MAVRKEGRKKGRKSLSSEVYLYRRMCSRCTRVCKVEKEMCNIARHFEGIGKMERSDENVNQTFKPFMIYCSDYIYRKTHSLSHTHTYTHTQTLIRSCD